MAQITLKSNPIHTSGDLPKVGAAAGVFVRQKRHAFGLPIAANASAFDQTVRAGDHFGAARHCQGGYAKIFMQQDFGVNVQAWRCAIGYQRGQAADVCRTLGMQSRDLPIVFHAEVQNAALSIGQADQGLNELVVAE